MILKQWASAQTGIIVKVPKGTFLHSERQYLNNAGEWSTSTAAWKECGNDPARKRTVMVTTEQDHTVEITISGGLLEAQALKAIKSRSGKSRDGAIILTRRKTK